MCIEFAPPKNNAKLQQKSCILKARKWTIGKMLSYLFPGRYVGQCDRSLRGATGFKDIEVLA